MVGHSKVNFQDDLSKDVVPLVKAAVQMAAIGVNKAAAARRQQYVDATPPVKGAMARLKKLRPEDNWLFGGKVGELAKAMRDESTVCFYSCFSNE